MSMNKFGFGFGQNTPNLKTGGGDFFVDDLGRPLSFFIDDLGRPLSFFVDDLGRRL